MSKYNKNCNKEKCSLERKLNEVGLTKEQVKKWLETGSLDKDKEQDEKDQMLFSFLGVSTKQENKDDELLKENLEEFTEYLRSVDGNGDMNSWMHTAYPEDCGPRPRAKISPQTAVTGRVVFVPGATAEDTEVYVNNLRVGGVCWASLEYDAELSAPKLTIEIMNPIIKKNI